MQRFPDTTSPLSQPGPVRVISVTAGKGGVGKTHVSINLGVALAARGYRVMLLDGDLALANIHVILSLTAQRNLSHVLREECKLKDIILTGPHGVQILPSATGNSTLCSLSMIEEAGLINAFSELQGELDFLIVDTASGISTSILALAGACQEVMMVVCNEPASIADSFAMINLLHEDYAIERIRIVANMTHTHRDSAMVFEQLLGMSDSALGAHLELVGQIPFDDHIRLAALQHRAVVDVFPRSPVAQALSKLAATVEKWLPPEIPAGRMEFFVERLIQGCRMESLP